MTRKLFFWALEKLHGSFSYIGAQRKLQKPELFMPQLLIKELWPQTCAVIECLRKNVRIRPHNRYISYIDLPFPILPPPNPTYASR